MLLGLMEAPANFQNMMNTLLGVASDYVAAYMDYVAILSKTRENQLQYIQKAL